MAFGQCTDRLWEHGGVWRRRVQCGSGEQPVCIWKATKEPVGGSSQARGDERSRKRREDETVDTEEVPEEEGQLTVEEVEEDPPLQEDEAGR